ncbi:hypothetical protein HPB47_010098 [Ixodes persulcatus]|uniref:Uncharacterized protein n=1 Tax=Ixodes persulcatus TaxID=34615 RepID=A0AC60P048_IXOPE|nr:hypothetical protein HPB47_010098 [Ixodes persulcatus]
MAITTPPFLPQRSLEELHVTSIFGFNRVTAMGYRGSTPGGREDYHAKRRFEDYKRLASQTTEFIWQQTRMQLPPKKKSAAICMDSVTVLRGAALPEEIKDVLNKEPKHSFEPERAIGDGEDCLKASVSRRPKDFFKLNELSLVQED